MTRHAARAGHVAALASRTTTARTSTCSSARTSSAARRSCALRVPRGSADDVVLRYVARRRAALRCAAQVDAETETETWWRASFPVCEPEHAVPLAARRAARAAGRWLNGIGPARPRVAGRRRLRPLARRRARRGTSRRSSTRSSPTVSRRRGARSRSARLGGSARVGRAADRPRPEHAARVVRRRPARDRGSASTTSSARRQRALPDADLPGGQHAPLRRDDASTASTRCSAATRRSRSLLARRARARACA